MSFDLTKTTLYAKATPATTPVAAANTGGLRYDAATNQWVVSVNGGPWLPIATGAISASPWEETGDASGATPQQPNVSLVNAQTYGVLAELRDANGGTGNPAGDFGVGPGLGDGGARAGELRVTRNVEAVNPSGATQLYADHALPGYFAGIYLQDGAIVFAPGLSGFSNVPGPWTGQLGTRGDMVSDSVTPRVRLGTTGGLYLCHYSVTFSADAVTTVTWAVNFGSGTLLQGRQAKQIIPAEVNDQYNVSGFFVYEDPGVNQQIQLAAEAPGDPAPNITVVHAQLMARRIA